MVAAVNIVARLEIVDVTDPASPPPPTDESEDKASENFPTTSKEDVDSVVGDANLTTGSNEAMAAYTAAISNTLTKIKV